MIGAIDPQKRDVTVVGGGVAGLLAAYTLDKQGFEVRLLEANQRLGGLIRTEHTPWGIAEASVHSIQATPLVGRFCDELGIDLLPVSADSRSRFILRNGKMRKFPLSPTETLSMFMRASVASTYDDASFDTTTVEEWAERYLGSTALQYLVSPMIHGVYGASPSEITIGAAFPFLKSSPGRSLLSSQMSKLRDQALRSRSQPHLRSLDRIKITAPAFGMGTIIDALEERLRDRLKNRLVLNCRLDSLPTAGNLVLAVPAFSAAKVLEKVDLELSESLSAIEYTPLVSATVFAKKESLLSIPKGLGVLMSPHDTSRCLGMIFNSSAFANRVSRDVWISCTVVMGGSLFPSAYELSDVEIQNIIKRELSQLFGLRGDLVACIIRRQRWAVPKYNRRVSLAWQKARAGWCSKPGRILFGNYTGKVSLRGMIDASYRMSHVGQ